MSTDHGHRADPTRSCDPVALLAEVQRWLRRRGVDMDPGPNQLRLATITAADLLRNLGVDPAITPAQPTHVGERRR